MALALASTDMKLLAYMIFNLLVTSAPLAQAEEINISCINPSGSKIVTFNTDKSQTTHLTILKRKKWYLLFNETSQKTIKNLSCERVNDRVIKCWLSKDVRLAGIGPSFDLIFLGEGLHLIRRIYNKGRDPMESQLAELLQESLIERPEIREQLGYYETVNYGDDFTCSSPPN